MCVGSTVLYLPGPMAFTLMLWGASDSAMQRVRLSIPPFEALYAAIVGMAMTPLTDDMVMIAPPRPYSTGRQAQKHTLRQPVNMCRCWDVSNCTLL